MNGFSHARRAAAAAALGGGLALATLGGAAAPALASAGHHKPTASHPAASRATPKVLSAAASPAESAVGDFSSGPAQVQFNAQRAAGAPATAATGTFTADLSLVPDTLASLAGPVTCLDVEGPFVGLFYPLTNPEPTVLGQVMKGVYVYAEEGAAGQPLVFSFKPSLSSTAPSCKPTPGLLPITAGTLTLTS